MNRKLIISTFIVFLFSFGILYSILWIFLIETDIEAHANFVKSTNEGICSYPANFLYYLVLNVLSGFSTSLKVLTAVATVLLSLAVAAKYYVSCRLAQKEGIILKGNLLFLIGLCFAFSPPNFMTGNYYLGMLPPNIWHNSTTIFLMPFALLLFWQGYQLLNNYSSRKLPLFLILIIINILIKPSFFMVFVIVFGGMFIFYIKRWKARLYTGLSLILGVLLMGGLYFMIYHQAAIFGTPYLCSPDSSIEIAFLRVWQSYLPFTISALPILVFGSLVFPITFALIKRNIVLRSLLLKYAWLCMGVAILFAVFLAETGTRAYHGDFFWQAIVCHYLLFFSTLMVWLQNKNKLSVRQNRLLTAVFFLHVLSGLGYFAYIFLNGTIL